MRTECLGIVRVSVGIGFKGFSSRTSVAKCALAAYSGTCSSSSQVICAGDVLPSTAPKLIMAAPAANAASISSGRSSSMYDLRVTLASLAAAHSSPCSCMQLSIDLSSAASPQLPSLYLLKAMLNITMLLLRHRRLGMLLAGCMHGTLAVMSCFNS